jgi:ribonuclease HI
MKANQKITVYTDGACSGNPGPGGWGALLISGPHEKKLCGGESPTTNNRMEMMAAIKGLEAIKDPSDVILITDSVYLKNGITQWIHNWKKKNWRTAAGGEVKNVDLWKELEIAIERHNIEWRWVKGHSGDYGNEMADTLANEGLDKVRKAS